MNRQYLYVIIGAVLAALFGAYTLGFFGSPGTTALTTPAPVASRTAP